MDSVTSISIDADRCRKDGLCAQVCPVRIFVAPKGDLPVVQRAEDCVLCGQCVAICAHQAILHSRLDLGRLVRIEERHPVEGPAAIELLRQRRSVRVYKSDPVPRDLLERIVEVAGFAPTSAHGKEGWVRSVTVVSGPDQMQRVRDLTVEYLRELRGLLGSAMVGFVARFKVEPRRGIGMLPDLDLRLAEHDQGRDAILYDAPAAVFVHTPEATHEPSADCDAALFAMMIAAQAHGLGTCWNGWLAKAASAFKAKRATGLRRMLAIPDHHQVGAAMTIGFPALRLHSIPQRETRIHWV
jgi:nitroreductase/NAD-dependent dihydropyrimidine dehydrogenase PreA subunit